MTAPPAATTGAGAGVTASTGRAIDEDARRLVQRVCPIVHRIGGAWFFTPQAAAAGADIGVTDPFALYAAGRGGVVGDGDPAVAATTFAFFPPAIVIAKYQEGTATRPAPQVAAAYAAGLAAWGDEVFADFAGAARLAELARIVADGVQHPMGLPLFVGWRDMPAPNDAPAALAMAMHVLRELRGDLHIHATVAYRLTPIEAILGKDGPERAQELFYPEPYPDPDTYTSRRHAAEELTDTLCADAYSALAGPERQEMAYLVDQAAHALTEWTLAGSGSPRN